MLTENNANKLEAANDVLESAIAQSMTIYGVTPSVGRIYSVLYFSQRAMTLKEIQDQVAMSKASMSNGLRELIEKEMIIKVWKKGKRQDHYIVEKDCYKSFLNYTVKILRQEKNHMMSAIEQTEPELIEILNNTNDEATKLEIEKTLRLIEQDKQYLDWTMRLASAMEDREIFNYIPK